MLKKKRREGTIHITIENEGSGCNSELGGPVPVPDFPKDQVRAWDETTKTLGNIFLFSFCLVIVVGHIVGPLGRLTL